MLATAALLTAEPTQHGHAFFAHEVRNLVNVAILSFEVLKTSGASVKGSNGQVLRRSLLDLRTLINRSLAEVRTAAHDGDEIVVADFINDIEAAATLEAQDKGIRLVVPPVDEAVVVAGDRQVLGAVVRNLLQNAFKFTRPATAVVLHVTASGDRVLIEVSDECGGLPDGCPDDLFRPYEQRGHDRTGLGLGLAFSREAVEAHHGTISARSLPGQGCVFTLDLPRVIREVSCVTATAGLPAYA
jgi:signal transduction histidine kinase